jgi:hypothetical protein
MRRNLSRFWTQRRDLLAPRQSNSARFSGITTPRKRPLGSEKTIFVKTTHIYLLATSNLEGEIHLKGGRFVTSQF